MNPPDAELLALWRDGDRGAGEQLFDRYGSKVARFFYNKVDHGVEDLVQQTFLACVESHARYRGTGSFLTFLMGIARNILAGHYRKRERGKRAFDMAAVSVAEMSATPSIAVAKNREQRLLLEALRRLPMDLQIALELHFWEEMTAKEIGEVLELPVGTVKSRLRRARQLLHENFLALVEGPELLQTTAQDLEKWALELRGAALGKADDD